MPDEYISREAAIEEIDKWLDTVGTALVGKGLSYYGELIGCIKDARAADVAEVVHARWERVRSNWYCTGCNKGYRITKGAPMASGFSYCPNCGAKMDGATE